MSYRHPRLSLHPFFTSRLFFLGSFLSSVVILSAWLFRRSGHPSSSVVDDRYGVVIGSDEYWQWGKFVDHNMDLIPPFNAHYSTVDDVPIETIGYSAVVLYLIADNRLRETILSLSYLYRNVPMQPWPIVLFFAEDMEDFKVRGAFMLHLYDALGKDRNAMQFMQRIEFVRLNWSLPFGLSHEKAVVSPVFEHAWPGYHMMCAFYASQIFEHPRLQNVTYYLRLDTDSYIYKPLCYDPIDLLHTHNRSYGFRSRLLDPAWVVKGMWDLTDEYARHHPDVEERMKKNGWEWPNLREQGRMGEEEYPTYYNNFEVVRLGAFRRPEVREWLDEIMKNPERIYKYRWGDAPIRFSTVNMFFDVPQDVEDYCGMPYWHNGHHGNVCSCEDQKAGRML